MKDITILLLLVGMTGVAQINGNGNVISKSFDIDPVNTFELSMYANVTLYASLSSTVQFKGESNMLENIDFELVDGKLNLQQKEWIEPTKLIEITIGVPDISRVHVDSHKTIRLINLDQERLALTALIGSIEASGSVKTVHINAESGKVDAGKLNVETAILNIWEDGRAIINASKEVKGTVTKDARISFVQQPERMSSAIEYKLQEESKNNFEDIEYITIKIKNNSWNRQHFEVKGPKPDGGRFGYGFPMIPGAIKKERWTFGTKVYKTESLGSRKLLLEVKSDDVGKTLNLFAD